MEKTMQKILEEISLDNMIGHMDFLVNMIGERQSGTDSYKQAAEYILQQLRQVVPDAWMDQFPMYTSYPVSASLQVLQPIDRSISALPICHTSSTDGFLRGELLDLKNGHYDDYEGRDVKGKILLTDMTWTPGRPEKARIAQEMGAKALIIMNWGKTEDENIQMGGVKSQWGNPTAETIKDVLDIPVLSITRKDGEYLRELCAAEQPVEVSLSSEVTREWVQALQPMAIIRGNGKKEGIVLLGGHLDAWGRTAICNSSGNALMLELARILMKHREKLERDVYLGFWDGHEVAECAGSTWFVDNYWNSLRGKCVAYLNVDNLAIRGTSVFGVESVPEMKPFLMDNMKELWKGELVWHDAHKGGGDSSFFGLGMPYIAIASEYTEEELVELNYAFYSPWLHTNEDTLDKVDQKLFFKHAEIFLSFALRLAQADIIPYDMDGLLKTLVNDVERLEELDHASWFDLSELKGSSARLLDIYQEMTPTLEPSSLNSLHMQMLFRISPVLHLSKSRYDQDPCCYHFSDFPIPSLYVVLWNLEKARKQSDEHAFQLWLNQSVKVRNHLLDQLRDCLDDMNHWR